MCTASRWMVAGNSLQSSGALKTSVPVSLLLVAGSEEFCGSYPGEEPRTPAAGPETHRTMLPTGPRTAACSPPLSHLTLAAALAQLPPAEVIPVSGGYMVVHRSRGCAEERYALHLSHLCRLCGAHRALRNRQRPAPGPETRLLTALHTAAAVNCALATASLPPSLRLRLMLLHQRARSAASATARSLAGRR